MNRGDEFDGCKFVDEFTEAKELANMPELIIHESTEF